MPHLDAPALARTYDHPSVADPWEVVEQYREVMAYHSRHPDAGRTYLSRRFELPEGRIRAWLEGSRPDAVRAIHVARDHGWLPTEEDTIPTALRQLVAWALAAGSVEARNYRPYFILSTPDAERRLEAHFEALNLELRIERREEGRSVEGTPAEHASVLGRVLTVLGVPTGKRITQLRALPAVLTDAPDEDQRACAATYLCCRGHSWDWNDQWVITHRDAPPAYLRSLADWLTSVTGTTCTATDDSVQLPPSVVSILLER